MRIGLVVPHIFMQDVILPDVIFSPGWLALDLAAGLQAIGAEVVLFTPGPVTTAVTNATADLSLFEHELSLRGDTYLSLLKKHPLTFISLARQVQSELLAQAYAMANQGGLDIVHIYTNEEDIALPFAALCQKPVVFTHHDPFNFLARYRGSFPKYKQLPWLSISMAQRTTMPADTNWVANIYHGLDPASFRPNLAPAGDYVAYLGRIIEPKGVHLAIAAVKAYNADRPKEQHIKLKIAGQHYAGTSKNSYWEKQIKSQLDETVSYVGFIKTRAAKQDFLGNAQALLVPSTFAEPFGMVSIEALACGTPVIGLKSGATSEIIDDGQTGFITDPDSLVAALGKINSIDRAACRQSFEKRFTLQQMCREHLEAYQKLIK